MDVSKEDILGGFVNAALLLYALILSPTIVAGGVGMEFFGALMTTTIIVTIIFTLANGIYAKVPFAQSVYMGENAFFAFSLVGAGIPFATALGIVFWAGVLFFIFSVSGLRRRFGRAIPRNLSLIWGFAVAAFLLYLAFFDAGLFKANTASGMPTLPVDYRNLSVLSFFPYLILIFLLIELVDVTGTLKALVAPLKLEDEEKVIDKVMHVEGVSTAAGALFGQPTVGPISRALEPWLWVPEQAWQV
ncbi:MAG: hypothetical protein OIN88_16970 [Candidatus Methanoperedens sp.]|nr:hypothetical protein [Candidatus Methanoperedens sp.]HLB69555.1 hypothetical protein [Candidatus Methanoperedens sp.]